LAGIDTTVGFHRRAWRTDVSGVLCTILVIVLGFCILYPILLIVLQSFQVESSSHTVTWGFSGWQAAFREPLLRRSLVNTLTLTAVREMITLPIAVVLAWLLARTDIPRRGALEFAFWIAFFLPPLTVTMTWILLGDPHYGLLNTLLTRLFGWKQGPFNVYSFWGLVWVNVAAVSVTVKVILLTPAFRYMNAAFEEASQVAGASSVQTAWRITVPIMAPVIWVVGLIGTLASLQAFETEQVLGTPFRFFVYSTMIYNLIESSRPSYAAATALAVLVLLATLPLVVLQQWVSRRRTHTTVTGQFKNQPIPLGAWRGPAFGLMIAVLAIVLGVPIVFSAVATFMKAFGFFAIAQPWTLDNWRTTFADPLFLSSLGNTLELAAGTAAIALLVYSLVAYVVLRSRFRLRRLLDFISWLPFTVPGLILGLALLWLFLDIPLFRPLYGSVWILILAGLLTGMPLGVQILKSNLQQLGPELEEASRVAGGSWFATYRAIVLRLLGPALLTVGLILFVGASRNVSYVALLSTSTNQPLSILQLNYIAEGKNEVAAVISFIILLASLTGALLARSAGFKGAAV
jgi:iron(III) transport system permease protein